MNRHDIRTQVVELTQRLIQSPSYSGQEQGVAAREISA